MSRGQVLSTSDEAAKFVTGIKGWVDSNGIFFGKDERAARYSGCTHRPCEDCSKPTEKGWLVCRRCKAVRDTDRYYKRETKKWDGKTPLYSEPYDRWFFDADDLSDFLIDVTEINARLVLCEPVFLGQINHDYWCDDLPEDGELPADVSEALEKLNTVIKQADAVSWIPGKYAADFSV